MKQSNHLYIWRLAGAAAATLLLLGAGCGRPDSAVPDDLPRFPQPLATGEVRLVEAPRFEELSATVRPMDRAVLAPRIMGVITEFPAELGRPVARGERLAVIAAGEIVARVEQARTADLQAARDLERESALLRQGAATAESVRRLEDRRRMTRAALEEAEVMLSYTRVDAPFDGVVVRTFAHEGDLAVPGHPLLELERAGPLRLEADVPERLVSRIRIGDTFEVTSGGREIRATLVELSGAADSRTRTVAAKFDLPADAGLASGSFARLRLPAETVRRIEAPAAAVSRFGQIERVFVVADGRARLQLVRTGTEAEGRVLILAGLSGGERVILNPPPGLRSGQPVELRP
ncbi:MAG: efflux RND transporter periplasmic adaptor subunit [Puniceicoccaceae bacterium]|nr:MAG: efflux RND transporter periplasmic adaptor subunit [Puniceicoccaceae bacterium]